MFSWKRCQQSRTAAEHVKKCCGKRKRNVSTRPVSMQNCLYLSKLAWRFQFHAVYAATHSQRAAQPECVLFKVGLTFREREKKKKKKEEGDTGGNKREKVKSMARTRRERAFTPSADQLGEGRKWDEEAQVLTREETGGAYGRRGVVFHIHALLGVRTKRDSKTTAAGARPSRHERGGWRSRNRELVKSGAAGKDEGNEKEHKERRGEEEGQREWEWRRGRRGESEGDDI